MLAEQQCYFALEMALRQRLGATDAKPGKSPGLGKLFKAAIEHGYLHREDFEMSPMSGVGSTQSELDYIRIARNHLAHGNINLLPQHVLMMMQLVAKVLNKLFLD
jgi:hypothetical protein